MNILQEREVQETVREALEASIYVQPRDHGLSVDELIEVGARVGLHQGEILDAIRNLPGQFIHDYERLRTSEDSTSTVVILGDFSLWEPWPRKVEAFQFIHDAIQDVARREGQHAARIDRDVLIENGQRQRGVSTHDMEVALAVMLLTGQVSEEGGRIRKGRPWATPRDQLAHQRPSRERPRLRRLLPIVRDVIGRRTDGRPAVAEPVPAFKAELDSLGHGRFSIWWAQTAGELAVADTSAMPTTVTVLAAALAEAALAFVVDLAKKDGRSMGTKNLEGPPTQWRFDDLLRGARAGKDPILGQKDAERCSRLNLARQRIHAGRLMSDIPNGPIPDCRPEEAREAKATLDALLRAILDWTRKPVPLPEVNEHERALAGANSRSSKGETA